MSDMQGSVGGKLFCITTDAVIIREGKVLLIKRSTPPFTGSWALPGGKVDIAETLADAARREAREEANIKIEVGRRIGVYDAVDRDPSKRAFTTAFLCTTKGEPRPDGEETSEAKWFPLDSLPALAFDHEKIIRDASAIQP